MTAVHHFSKFKFFKIFKTFFSKFKFFFQKVGITSWGKACGQENVPGVYASIPNNLCFINAITDCIHGKKYNDFIDYNEVETFSTTTLN